jgi:hypothetical protein
LWEPLPAVLLAFQQASRLEPLLAVSPPAESQQPAFLRERQTNRPRAFQQEACQSEELRLAVWPVAALQVAPQPERPLAESLLVRCRIAVRRALRQVARPVQ